MPTLVKAAHTHLARFASKPVPRAYVPKRARSRAGGMSARTEPVTSQDSLAAEVLLSLCPSGFREMASDVGDGVVDSAALSPEAAPDQPLAHACVEPEERIPDEQASPSHGPNCQQNACDLILACLSDISCCCLESPAWCVLSRMAHSWSRKGTL